MTDELTHLLSRPGTMAGRLQRAAYALLMEHYKNGEIPTNGRFIWYELKGRSIVFTPEDRRKRRGTADRPGPLELCEATMHLREVGLIPWPWIVDETRTLTEWEYADSVADYVRDQLVHATINPWDGAPPLLLVESRSLGGVLRRIVSPYCVPIAATNGQVGGFLHTDIVPLLERAERPVLYLGDLDHQGDQIEANTRDVLERELGYALDWTRIALTEEQVQEGGFEPIIKTDTRYRPARTFEAWETEVLGQSTITRLVTEALDTLLPEPLEDVQEREKEERGRVEEILGAMGQ